MPISLKAARVNAGYNQQDAANKLNITKATLANYEMCKTSPSISKAAEIAALYKMSIDDICWDAQR